MMRILSLILAVAGFAWLTGDVRAMAIETGAIETADAIPLDVLAAIKKATVFVKVQVQGRAFSGSGFVVKMDDGTAYVVTNHHVIEPHLVEIVAEWRTGPRPRTPRELAPGIPHGPYQRSRPRTPTPAAPSAPVLTPRVVARTLKNAEVTVVFQSGLPQEQSLRAEVLAADPQVDLAILKAVGVKHAPSPVDCNHDIELVETMPVYSFGFPFGQVLATSKGSPAITIGKASVSSLRRDDASELTFVQIDGALNPGNSGGPVVDTHGRLVGVAVATIKDSTGIGLAIPCKKVPAMLAGRLGKPHLQLMHNADGTPTIQVEVGLVDPFHRIRSAALHYVSADQVQTKPGLADRLKALPGSRQLALKIQEQVAQGQIPVKPGLSRIHILYQGVSVDADGVHRYTASVDETLDLQAARSAEPFVADNLPKEPADGSKPNIGPKPFPAPRPGTRLAPENPNPSLESSQEVAALVDDLNSGDHGRRIRATMQLLRAMPRQPNAAVAKALERILLEEGSSPLRVNAARALGTWGTQKSIPALQEAADKDPDSIVRSRAKKAIEAIKLRQGANAMSPETVTPRFETQPAPAETVASKRDTPSTPDNASKSPPGPKPSPEFAAVVDDLNSSDFSRRIPATLKLLREKPKEPNLAVAKALERVLLEDGDPPIRDSAARALQNWGTSESIPALQKAVEKDPDSQVRTSAQKAIEAIKAR